jgi:hypothetical protein
MIIPSRKKRPYIQLKIMHLLHYHWEGPSIGARIRFGRHCDHMKVYGVIIPIPQWYSDLLILFSKQRTWNEKSSGYSGRLPVK